MKRRLQTSWRFFLTADVIYVYSYTNTGSFRHPVKMHFTESLTQ